MKKDLLDRNIGRLVNISLIDGQIIMGLLDFCPESFDKHGWVRPSNYVIGNVHFVAKEVKSLELI